MPRLDGIPSGYSIQTGVREAAELALALMDIGFIDIRDYQGEGPVRLIERSLSHYYSAMNTGEADLRFTLTVEEGVHYLLVHVERGSYLDFSQGAHALDAIHPQLGPSLLHHLSLFTPLTPTFTPEVCRDLIEITYWEGWEDAENLLEMARHDLAYAREAEAHSLNDAEVAAYADEHYFTPNRVNAQLETHYQKPDILPLEAMLRLCEEHGLQNTGRACTMLQGLKELTDYLPRQDGGYLERGDGNHPFGIVVTVKPEGMEEDLLSEILREYDESVWQSGDYDPSYVFSFQPADKASLLLLKDTLETCRGILETSQEVLQTLEVISCLLP